MKPKKDKITITLDIEYNRTIKGYTGYLVDYPGIVVRKYTLNGLKEALKENYETIIKMFEKEVKIISNETN